MIEFRGLTKTFEGKDGSPIGALQGLDLSVGPGDFLVLTGPSGSGKSTLLFTAAGMQRPTEGEVLFSGRDVYRLSPAERAALRRTRIGFVFQTFNLIPYLSCLENAALPAVLEDGRRSAAMSRARSLLERVGLGSRLSHRPAELSVGERQRAAVCRSLINSPDVVLADEPTGNLDSGSAEGIIEMLLEEHSRGRTIVMVTHDPRLGGRGTRTVSLDEGRIVEDRPLRPKGEDA